MQLTTPNTVPMNTNAKEVSSVKKPAEFSLSSPVAVYKNDQEKDSQQLRFDLKKVEAPTPNK